MYCDWTCLNQWLDRPKNDRKNAELASDGDSQESTSSWLIEHGNVGDTFLETNTGFQEQKGLPGPSQKEISSYNPSGSGAFR